MKKIILSLTIALLLNGCATNDTYRQISDATCIVVTDDKGKAINKCDGHSIQLHNQGQPNKYTLGFVEINDQGQFRDNRQQLNSLIKALESTSNDEPLIISVFVHGWHHNAKEGDPNIESFKKSLAELAEVYKDFAIKRKVFGVYVGWRGDSVNVDYINEFTFWDRKNTADNVGHVSLSELLLRLEKVKNDKNQVERERNADQKDNKKTKGRNRLAIIGHSFGGAAVFQSTAQIMASRFMLSQQKVDANTKSDNKTIKGIGDVVVLINPAFEAIKYAPLFDLAQAQCKYEQMQKPKLVILTSENDNATKKLFPIGRFFSTLFEKHGVVRRNDCGLPITFSESDADKTAVGHFEPLITHKLKPVTKASSSTNTFRKVACDDWPSQKNGEPINFGLTDLISLGKTVERNPYLNIKVDSKISNDHNDIFGKELLDFIQLVTFASTDPNCDGN